LITDRNLESFQDLIKEIEFNNINTGLKRRGFYEKEKVQLKKEIMVDKSFEFELCLRVPSVIWGLMLPKDGQRRQTYLSLLQSCSSMRKHLLPLFQILDVNHLRGLLFEGFYYKRKKDYKHYLKLEGESYLQVTDYFEKSVEAEGTWSVSKRDLSNNYYVLQVQFHEKLSNIKHFKKREKEVELFLPTKTKWKPTPTPIYIFSRYPKIEFPIDFDKKILRITQEEFNNKRVLVKDSYLSFYSVDFLNKSPEVRRISSELFSLIPKTIPNYKEIFVDTPYFLQSINDLPDGNQLRSHLQKSLITYWVELSPSLSNHFSHLNPT